MADMKENMENEIQATHDVSIKMLFAKTPYANFIQKEYIKMDAHVRLYIKEMEQNIS